MANTVKCPECGKEFKKPLFGQKRSGVGFTLAVVGDLVCPECGYKGHTGLFVAAEKASSAPK